MKFAGIFFCLFVAFTCGVAQQAATNLDVLCLPQVVSAADDLQMFLTCFDKEVGSNLVKDLESCLKGSSVKEALQNSCSSEGKLNEEKTNCIISNATGLKDKSQSDIDAAVKKCTAS